MKTFTNVDGFRRSVSEDFLNSYLNLLRIDAGVFVFNGMVTIDGEYVSVRISVSMYEKEDMNYNIREMIDGLIDNDTVEVYFNDALVLYVS